MDIDWEKIGAGLAGLLVGGGALAFKFRRANSREKVEARTDDAVVGMISRLESERDEARAEAKREREQRIADAVRIARLESDKEDLERYARRLLRLLPQEIREVHETDFAPMCELPPERKS